MTDLEILLLVGNAQNGNSEAVIEALQAINSYHEKGEVPPPELCEWFKDNVQRLADGYRPDLSTAKKQRVFSGAFGFTPYHGRPETKGIRNYKIACAIYRISQTEKISIEKTMSNLIENYPDYFGDSGSLDYLWDIWKEHSEGAKGYYQDWLETMIMNNERGANTS